MVPFGTHARAVGTPSFTAPEVVMRQPLDGRTDLYSLGATAYFASRAATPTRPVLRQSAQRVAQPSGASLPPRARYSGGPRQLVLSYSTSRRPAVPRVPGRSLSGLRAIAGIQLDEQLQVQRSFLTTPSLVGRDGLLPQVRRQMIHATRGGGTSIFLTGIRGVASPLCRRVRPGRQARRRLGAARRRQRCAGRRLELRTVITRTARVGVARPGRGTTRRPGRRSRPRMARATEITGPVPLAPLRPLELRAAAQDSLLNLMEEVSHRSFLVVTADDVDCVDEPSRAFIALLRAAGPRLPHRRGGSGRPRRS